MSNMFFDSWESILRASIVTVLGCSTLVFAIRISGKRTLSKMNAFDFIVTIALGSCLAAISLNRSITLADGVIVYSTLIGLQFLLTWLSVRVSKVKAIVSGQPVVLLYHGALFSDEMKKERITIEELYIAARAHGRSYLEDIEAVDLETTGDIVIISRFQPGAENPKH